MGIYGSLQPLTRCKALIELDIRNCNEIDDAAFVLGEMPDSLKVHWMEDRKERSASGSIDSSLDDLTAAEIVIDKEYEEGEIFD